MTRDFTLAQFKAAAARNGFEVAPGGFMLTDTTGKTKGSFGSLNMKRRDLLAAAIKNRDRKTEARS